MKKALSINFFKLTPILIKMKSLVSMKVFFKLISLGEPYSNKVILSTASRVDICKDLKIANGSLSKALSELSSLKLIEGEKGSYSLNEEIVLIKLLK